MEAALDKIVSLLCLTCMPKIFLRDGFTNYNTELRWFLEIPEMLSYMANNYFGKISTGECIAFSYMLTCHICFCYCT